MLCPSPPGASPTFIQLTRISPNQRPITSRVQETTDPLRFPTESCPRLSSHPALNVQPRNCYVHTRTEPVREMLTQETNGSPAGNHHPFPQSRVLVPRHSTLKGQFNEGNAMVILGAHPFQEMLTQETNSSPNHPAGWRVVFQCSAHPGTRDQEHTCAFPAMSEQAEAHTN